MNVKKIISVRRYKCGYEVRKQLVDGSECGSDDIEMNVAYTPSGDYIGRPKAARFLVFTKGIMPELRTPESSVCSIGYSHKDGKWYGWSHRAICGFKVGSTCKKGHCHYIPKNEGGKGEWTAKSTKDAKRMAMDFASGVS